MMAGALNTRVTIEQLGDTQDAIGQPVQAWTTFATLWADVKFNSGVESIKAGAETSVIKASIRIRYNATITTDMRVVAGPYTFGINAVLPDLKGRKHTDLVCEVING